MTLLRLPRLPQPSGPGCAPSFAMAGHRSAAPLPTELNHIILSFLPRNEIATTGRHVCKSAALLFSGKDNCIITLSQPLPPHVTTTPWSMDSAAEALQQLTLLQKKQLPATTASSGTQANVVFAVQLVQPQMAGATVPTAADLLKRWEAGPLFHRPLTPSNVGPTAVASGLAHLLPALEQRCPALLDPELTLQAAVEHCDLAGLQAAWDLLEARVPVTLGQPQQHEWCLSFRRFHGETYAESFWRRMLRAAAASASPDAVEKMSWIVEHSRSNCGSMIMTRHEDVYGMAAASGDLSRTEWLRERGFRCDKEALLVAVLQHADCSDILRLEEEGGWLPPPDAVAWNDGKMVAAAAGSPRDSAAKLAWLAGRGSELGAEKAMEAAARAGNLEALQLLVTAWRERNGEDAALPDALLVVAVTAGHVPVADWLHQAGCPLSAESFRSACRQGSLPLLQWLLDAGCPHKNLGVHDVVAAWPSGTVADSQRLAKAVELLPDWPFSLERSLYAAASARHPWSLWRTLLPRVPEADRIIPFDAAKEAAAAGCEATLEALVEDEAYSATYMANRDALAASWYGAAAGHHDWCTLERLQRLGVPVGGQVLVEAYYDEAPLSAMLWLVERGAPYHDELVDCLLEAEDELGLPLMDPDEERHRKHQRCQVLQWLHGWVASHGR